MIDLPMDIYLANPRGMCAGVERAIEVVERVLEMFGAPIYVRHEVVHNRYVVDELRQQGTIFVDDLSEVPEGEQVIFSAHGVSPAVVNEAKQRKLRIFDATCPLVTKVHMEVARYARNGYECILIGHRDHVEVEGTMGHYETSTSGKIYLVEDHAQAQTVQVKNPEKLSYVTQTTLSLYDTANIIAVLKKRFPNIRGPKRDDICYATRNRQDAVQRLAKLSDVILVIGSPNSSNSTRLKELAEAKGSKAYLIDNHEDIKPEWLQNISRVGVTAGASAPEILVQKVLTYLLEQGGTNITELPGEQETMFFHLPQALKFTA